MARNSKGNYGEPDNNDRELWKDPTITWRSKRFGIYVQGCVYAQEKHEKEEG